MDLDTFLKKVCGPEGFLDIQDILNTVESCFQNTIPDDGMLENSKVVLCFVLDVYSSRCGEFNARELDLFIKLLSLVLEGCLLFERSNKKYHRVVMKFCELICTLKSNMKIRILQNCYPAMLKLSVKGCIPDHTKRKLLFVCSHLLHGIKKSVKFNILPRISEALYDISEALGEFGDHFLQTYATEVLFRFSNISPEMRENIATRLKQHRTKYFELTFKEFDVKCRMLLNDINSTRCDVKKVISIACYRAFIGTQELLKPKIKDYDELWIDFNFGTRNISFICDAESLSLEKDSKNKTEYITVHVKCVESYDFRRIIAQHSVVKDRYHLKLKLLEPYLCKQLKSVEVVTKVKYLSFWFKASSVPSFMDVFILPQFFCLQVNQPYLKEKTSQKEHSEMLNASSYEATPHKLQQLGNEIHMLSIRQEISDLNFMKDKYNRTFQRDSSSENSQVIQSSYTFTWKLSLNSEEKWAQLTKVKYNLRKCQPTEEYNNNLSVTDPTFEKLLCETLSNTRK